MADIPRRSLGKTGLEVSVIGVGGYHIGKDRNADLGSSIIRTAIDEGVNFLDNAWCYNGGESERIMGIALGDGYRDKVVLMTKNHGRDAKAFRSQLEESLTRLKTDTIDLVQLHEIIQDGIPEKIAAEGVLEEALRAREAGKLRFIGFTGHRRPYLLKQMLAIDFPWDTVQLPANLLDYHYLSFEREVLPLLVRRNIGIIGMKSLGGNGENMLSTGVTAQEAISYSLSLPISTLVSGMDSVQLVHENLRYAREYRSLSDDERDALRAKVAPHAQDGSREKYKTG